jgi:hypothetical protein
MLEPNARRFERNRSRLPCPPCSAGAAEAAAHRHMGFRHVGGGCRPTFWSGPGTRESLAAQGLIRKIQKDAWTMCQAGMTFTAATARSG